MMLEKMILENVKKMPPSGIRNYFDMVYEMEGVMDGFAELGIFELKSKGPWSGSCKEKKLIHFWSRIWDL